MSDRAVNIVKRTILVCAVLLICLSESPHSRAAQSNAGTFVKTFGDHAISVLTVKNISAAEREGRFRALLHKGFDLKRISRFVLGRYARGAKAESIDEYHRLFEDLIVSNYAARFAEYSGQSFVIGRVTKHKNRRSSVVLSEIRSPAGGPPIRVDWQVENNHEQYKIFDVRIEGVSMGMTQREEFTTVIRNNGGQLESLIAILRKKTKNLNSK